MTHSESDIKLLGTYFKVDRDKAIEMLDGGFNMKVLRNGFDIFKAKLSTISKNADKVIDSLTDEINQANTDLQNSRDDITSD